MQKEKKIVVGQKLYHYAYGPLTVTAVIEEKSGNYVETVDDFPEGFRQKRDLQGRSFSKEKEKQTWIYESIGHWLFETPNEVGSEDNDWLWEEYLGYDRPEPLAPIKCSQDKERHWHQWYFDNGFA